jgi:hypothetical protein
LCEQGSFSIFPEILTHGGSPGKYSRPYISLT